MLVLSRKVGQDIVIGEKIVVRLIRISGGQVCMGIEAPQAVSILRGELADAAFATRAKSAPTGKGAQTIEVSR